MDKVKCPVCSSDVVLGDEAVESDMVTCNNCRSDLEIVSLHPAQLKEMSYGDEGLIDEAGDDAGEDEE